MLQTYSTRIEPETRRDVLASSREILAHKFEKLQQRVSAIKSIDNPKLKRVEQLECAQEMESIRTTEAALNRVERQTSQVREVR